MPTGIVATGFPAVEATCRQLKLLFDPWQTDLNRCILAKARGGLYAADTVVISIPRQVGKTWDIGALVFADCIINPGTTTVWTAHRFKVARETFNSLKAIALSPALAPHIDPDAIYTAAGNESITFRNGSRIVFAARERGAIRGFTKVRRLILDEGQILTENALADLAPTMNQAQNPQIIIMGTPPRPIDPGEVFTRLRTEALSGDSEDVLYVEFSADPESDPDDREAWAKANPSYPTRTSTKAIQRLRKLLSPEDFAREVLGIWDEDALTGAFTPGTWAACLDDRIDAATGWPVSQITGTPSLALDVSPDHSRASLAVAGLRDDGLRHIEAVDHDRDRPGVALRGTAWVVPRVMQVLESSRAAGVILDPGSAAGALIGPLREAGANVIEVSGREYAQACGAIFDAVENCKLRHLGQPELDAAVRAARQKAVGDAWKWDRRDMTGDITPLVAATLALFGVENGAVSVFFFGDLDDDEEG